MKQQVRRVEAAKTHNATEQQRPMNKYNNQNEVKTIQTINDGAGEQRSQEQLGTTKPGTSTIIESKQRATPTVALEGRTTRNIDGAGERSPGI